MADLVSKAEPIPVRATVIHEFIDAYFAQVMCYESDGVKVVLEARHWNNINPQSNVDNILDWNRNGAGGVVFGQELFDPCTKIVVAIKRHLENHCGP